MRIIVNKWLEIVHTLVFQGTSMWNVSCLVIISYIKGSQGYKECAFDQKKTVFGLKVGHQVYFIDFQNRKNNF